MENDKSLEKCKPMETPLVGPGWGCCKCRTYNGNQSGALVPAFYTTRSECKHCGHLRCDNLKEKN